MKLQKYKVSRTYDVNNPFIEYAGAYAGTDFFFNKNHAQWGVRENTDILKKEPIDTIDVDIEDVENVVELIKANRGFKQTTDKLF